MIKLLHVIVMKSETRDAVCVFAVSIVYSVCTTAALSFCNCIYFGLLVFFTENSVQQNTSLCFRGCVKTSIAFTDCVYCRPTKPPTVCDVNKSILHRKKQELAEFWLAAMATGFISLLVLCNISSPHRSISPRTTTGSLLQCLFKHIIVIYIFNNVSIFINIFVAVLAVNKVK